MRLHYADISIERSSTEYESAGFRMGDERALFEMLRKRIYSNPIRAVCQEVMSNAKDAHIEVDTPEVPIEVKLPTKLDPIYAVTDKGPGICKWRMYTICIAYGMSTKRHSDKFIGGWGLGFKVPFAYGSSFTIITVAEERINAAGVMIDRDSQGHFVETDEETQTIRVKYYYIALIDESGKGEMTCQSIEVGSQEECGTTIQMTVKPEDFGNFYKYTKEISCFWEAKPIIHGYPEWEWPENKITAQGPGWKLLESRPYNSPIVLIDEIPYPLAQASISDVKDGWNVNSGVLSLPLLLRFKTGEISVTAARDAIDYQTKTVHQLRKRLSRVTRQLEKELRKEMDQCQTIQEALDCYARMCRDNRRGFASGLHWKGFKLSKFNSGLILRDEEGLRVRCFQKSDQNKYGVRALEVGFGRSRDQRTNAKGEHRTHRFWKVSIRSRQGGYNLLVEKDTTQKNVSIPRISTLFDQHPNVSVIYVVDFPGKTPEQVKLGYRRLNTKWLWNLFNPIKLSTVQRKQFPRLTKRVRKIRVRELRKYGRHWSTSWKNDVEIDVDEKPGVYVIYYNRRGYLRKGPVVRGQPDINDIEVNRDKLRKLLDFTRTSDKKQVTVYGITPTDAKRLPKSWKSLEQYVKRRISTLRRRVGYGPRDEKFSLARKERAIWGIFSQDIFHSRLVKNSLMRRCIELSLRIENHSREMDEMRVLIDVIPSALQAPLFPLLRESIAQDLWEDAQEKYPLLFALSKQLSRHGHYYQQEDTDRIVAKIQDNLLGYIQSRDTDLARKLKRENRRLKEQLRKQRR